MFKSFINPQKITGNGTKAAAPEAFSNFMTGGASSGSSVSTGAANNISNFSRGNVSVEGSSPNLTPLITNISTSIVNNVDNSISNTLNSFKTQIQSVIGGLQNQAQSNLTAVIQNFTKDYQQRIQNKEDNKPSNVLKGFLGLYQNAINFVTFFGDSKNNKKIETSLKSLRKMFDESFNTAMVIRQTINKIVRQLSNLPSASASSGGLNLDVNVPGGPLKQAGRASISKFIRGGGGKLLGAGVAGVGAVGIGMMGMQAAKASQEEKLASTAKKGIDGEDKSNDFMKGLNDIIERFSDSINSLLGVKKNTSGGGGGAPGGGGSPGGGSPGGEIQTSGKAGTQEQQALLKSISFAEGTTKSYGTIFGGKNVPELEKGELTVREVYDMMNSGTLKGRNVGYSSGSRATGRYQFMPDTLSDIVKSGDIKWEEKFTPEVQDRAILSRISNFRGVTPELLKKEGLSANVSNKLAPEFASFPTTSGSSYYGQPVKKLKDIQNVYTQDLNTQRHSTATPQTAQKPESKVKPALHSTPTVEPAPKTPEAQKVSQAVTASPGQDKSNKVEVASLPPDITVIPGGGSQDGGGAVASLPSPSMDAPDVSMYGRTADTHNPYWSLPYTLGIINV